MKTKTIPIEKFGVQRLNDEQLKMLKDFGRSDVYKILLELAKEAKMRRAFEAVSSKTIEEVAERRGNIVGIDFMLDIVNRATEQLEGGSEIDNKE